METKIVCGSTYGIFTRFDGTLSVSRPQMLAEQVPNGLLTPLAKERSLIEQLEMGEDNRDA